MYGGENPNSAVSTEHTTQADDTATTTVAPLWYARLIMITLIMARQWRPKSAPSKRSSAQQLLGVPSIPGVPTRRFRVFIYCALHKSMYIIYKGNHRIYSDQKIISGMDFIFFSKNNYVAVYF